MRSRALRISAVFAAAFGMGIWLGSMAHALSVPPDSNCSVVSACCRTLPRSAQQTQIHEARTNSSVCLLCQLGAAPVVFADAPQLSFVTETAAATHSFFVVKSEPALLYYSPPGRAPPISA